MIICWHLCMCALIFCDYCVFKTVICQRRLEYCWILVISETKSRGLFYNIHWVWGCSVIALILSSSIVKFLLLQPFCKWRKQCMEYFVAIKYYFDYWYWDRQPVSILKSAKTSYLTFEKCLATLSNIFLALCCWIFFDHVITSSVIWKKQDSYLKI